MRFRSVHALTVILALVPLVASAQTTTYHLHNEASLVNGANKQLKTTGPDATQTVLRTVNLRVLTQTLADPNAQYTFAYTTDTGGNVTRTDVTNPRGFTTRYNFNADHQLTSMIEALNQPEQRTTTYQRAPSSHLVTAVIDGLNRRTEYEYDDSGHVQTMRQLADTEAEVTTTYTYEPKFFQLASVTDPSLHTWSFGYNSAGRIASTTDPLTHQTTFATNAQGLVTAITDPLQHTWQSGYTGGDQTSRTNPLGFVWSSFVDGAGRVLSTTDPLGRITRRVPDKLNRVRTTTDAMGGQMSLDYDPNGRLLALTDALTHSTSYTYDTSDRLATRLDPLQATISYAYDRNDNLTGITDRRGQESSLEYDALDRPTLVTYADDSTTEYVYDAGDRVTQIIDSVSGTISRDYDLLDRLTLETSPEGSVNYTYFADGRRETMTVAGQPTVAYGYDDAHRLTSITQGESIVSLTYDNADRRATLTLPNGIVATYGYDDADQLTALTYTLGPATLGTLTYAYDGVGNRTTVGGTWARTGLPQALSEVTYDAANRIATWAGQSFSYDANGNLASEGLTSFNWNARNQLVGLSGATSATFEYDGLGRRRAKSVSGVSTGFLYDGLNMVQELTSGSPSANIMPGLGVDEWLRRTDAAGTRHFLPGSLGSTVALADDLGTVQTEYTFEPFGKTSESGSLSSNALAFTGREDDGTGLLFYRARYYDPSRQRFLSEDPIGFGGGDVNLYSYTFNSPTNLTDPTGEIVPALLVPILMQCLKGAGMDIGMDLLERILSGRKSPSIPDLLKTGVSGCLSDLLNPWDRFGDLMRMAKKAGKLARTAPKNLAEQLTLEEAMGGAGERIMEGAIKDSNFPENQFAKMQHVHVNPDGTNIVIHYWKDLSTGQLFGFKFK